MPQFNAARRLHDIFQRTIKDSTDGKLPIYRALAGSLGIQDPVKDKHKFTDLFILLADVERCVSQLQRVENKEDFLEAIREIETQLFVLGIFQGTWDSLKTIILSRNFLLVLSSCANFIAQEQVDPLLSDQQLENYLKECESLLQEVMASDLDQDIKTFLVVRLEEICSAIRHYTIGGPERLRTVVEASIGAIVIRSGDISNGNTEKSVISKIFHWCLDLGAILDLASNTQNYLIPTVIEVTKRLFLPPGS